MASMAVKGLKKKQHQNWLFYHVTVQVHVRVYSEESLQRARGLKNTPNLILLSHVNVQVWSEWYSVIRFSPKSFWLHLRLHDLESHDLFTEGVQLVLLFLLLLVQKLHVVNGCTHSENNNQAGSEHTHTHTHACMHTHTHTHLHTNTSIMYTPLLPPPPPPPDTHAHKSYISVGRWLCSSSGSWWIPAGDRWEQWTAAHRILSVDKCWHRIKRLPLNYLCLTPTTSI